MLTFGKGRRLPIVLQAENSECGLACLAMVSSYYGKQTDLVALRARFGLSSQGATLRTLMQIAEGMSLSTRALRLDLEDLAKLKRPAILHWRFDHFVVLKSVSRRGVVVHDPAVGKRRYRLHELGQHFTGIALELAPQTSFTQGDERQPLRLATFWRGVKGLGASLVQILALSILVQAFALATPFYMQIVVDDVLVKHDADLLTILATGFLLLTLIGVVTKAVRGFASLYLVNQLGYNIGNSVLHHLIRLPLAYFEKRHMGDVVSRFGSLQPIQNFITGSAIAITIDGLLSAAALALMIVYAPQLALVVVVVVLGYALFRWLQFTPLREAKHEYIASQAKLDSTFMESIRSLQGIKVRGRELERQAAWRNQYAHNINANAKVGRLTIYYEAANAALVGAEYVLIIYLGAQHVLEGAMTIGMLYAFIAYRRHFSSATTSLIDQFIEYRMLGLHLDRLADITQTPMEAGLAQPSTLRLPVKGALSVKGLSFQYSPSDPAIFKDFHLDVKAGDFVVLFGPSGVGKTTLMKLLMGLLEPECGEVLVDGRPLHSLGLVSYRDSIAAVMQDDTLFSGSLKDNIAFFDLKPDYPKIERAAQLACIHDVIQSSPMGYDAHIGDMGSALSMGQQQRVLLARALYADPAILFLDEGTAHVDAATEAQILEHLAEQAKTVIYITHNPSLIERADVLVEWQEHAQIEVSYPKQLPEAV